ncbi:MAG: GGDEF domain-containing protein [Butyrivibrio sp.]|nr:GGDEF domain-containing protein [Butyrivibrio sp.]
MNIGLLLSELEDPEVKRICIGADKAARDLDVNLVIFPGKYLVGDKPDEKGRLFDYQYTALFEYADTDDLDVLVIDAERIAKKSTILKKDAFLKKFDKAPVLTMSKQEGYTNVNKVSEGKDEFEQQGYEAVYDAYFFKKNNYIPHICDRAVFEKTEINSEVALSVLSEISNVLLHRKYETEGAYNEFTSLAVLNGVSSSGVLLYDEKIRNTIKYPWQRPKNITNKSVVVEGKDINADGEKIIFDTAKIISQFIGKSSKTFILGDIFVGEYQLGLMFSELVPIVLHDHFFDNVISVLTGVSRLAYLERELDKRTDELYEAHELLARDDSVLEHIGDQDLLTGGLNRRGFFAKAYDLLKDSFKDGMYAVVAYIHLESLKRINELYGHEEGDRAVKKISGILQEVFPEGIIGRIRGDEFAVILLSDTEGIAEVLREKMADQNNKLLSDSSRYYNHLQYSICEFGHDKNLSLREMLKETDENLQIRKGNGL